MLLPFTSSASWPAFVAVRAAVETEVHWLKGVGDQSIRRGVGQDRAEIALISVVVDLPYRPGHRLAHGPGIEIAGAGYVLGTTRPAEHGEKENDGHG